jgi:hypothetical protein
MIPYVKVKDKDKDKDKRFIKGRRKGFDSSSMQVQLQFFCPDN